MAIAMVVNKNIAYVDGRSTITDKAEEYREEYGSCEVELVNGLYRMTFPLLNGDTCSIDWAEYNGDGTYCQYVDEFARAVSLPADMLSRSETRTRNAWIKYLKS